MKLSTKIVTGSIVAVVLCALISLAIQARSIHKQGIELTFGKMRSAILQAENIRLLMAHLNNANAFDKPRLLAEAKTVDNYQHATIYKTLPIVASWNSIEDMADKEGYHLRIPKEQARNPKNTPRPDELEILNYLNRTSASEYATTDTKSNQLVYARPIRLTTDCLSCHGDPKNSPTGDGKDVLGFQMENWKEGEIHGAYVLRADLDRVNKAIRQNIIDGVGMMLLCLLPFITAIGVGAWWINRKQIARPLEATARQLLVAEQETIQASKEIADASSQLATGASEQAAALEELSASLEEIRSMAHGSAEHAEEAKKISNLASGEAKNGTEAMNNLCVSVEKAQTSIAEMKRAMDQLQQSGSTVIGIVKTIDDIACQTNILALNAAVEAARAGEAGAGFAVVADEVRTLAKRSAEAAHETATLIQDSISKSNQGAASSEKVANDLQEVTVQAKNAMGKLQAITTHTSETNRTMEEIAAASREQQTGINQIFEAVSHIDQTTQASAAQSEETASAAAQLQRYADNLKDAVGSLVALLEGSAKDASVEEPTTTVKDSPPMKSTQRKSLPPVTPGAVRSARFGTPRNLA